MRNRQYVIAATVSAVVLLLVILLVNSAADPQPDRAMHNAAIDTPAGSVPGDASSEFVPLELTQPPVAESEAVADRPRFDCPEPAHPEGFDFADMAAALRNSDDPEHLLMASLYGGKRRRPEPSPFPEQRNLESLFKGLEIEPRNEILLWNAMTLCAESGEQDRCDEQNIPELATAVLGNNANFWFRLAAIRADADDMEGAYAALERSISAMA